MKPDSKSRRTAAACVAIVVALPLLYLALAPPAAVLIYRSGNFQNSVLLSLFAPAEFVCDRVGLYERYVELFLD